MCRLMFKHPVTGENFFEGDVVRTYLFNEKGQRDGLSRPYEILFFNKLGFVLKDCRHIDYLDIVGPNEQLVVTGQATEEVGHIPVVEGDLMNLVKVYLDEVQLGEIE